MKTHAAVVGASGYAGGELIRFLDGHPGFDLVLIGAHSKAGQSLASVHPHLGGGDRPLVAFDADRFAEAEVVFLAMPHGASAGPAMDLLARGVTVIDLGSDFRLPDQATYKAAYGNEHPFPDELGGWAYGLPELFADAIAVADRIAVPGCYPTSAILPLAPLVGSGLVNTTDIVVDSMSGVSGAGRNVAEATSFGSVDESARAYKVLEHRHQPEMIASILAATGKEVDLVFTPHLVPMQRGILSTIYLRVKDGVTADDVETVYAKTYIDSAFVQVSPTLPETRWVVGSNNALISYRLDERTSRLVVICAIDNLVKGAAGQAIQCANLVYGHDQTAGLPTTGWMP